VVESGCGRTHPVGGKTSNPLGLYDINGNVCQWCADYWEEKYYQNSPNKDPQNILKNDARVCRGSAWGSVVGYCRAACRLKVAPGFRIKHLGFRVCLRPD
jgi:formylglycine-generating enzyme